MASPARDGLISHRVGARTREIGIDLPHKNNHPARDFLTRVFVRFKRLAGAMAVTAVHFERVAEVVHDRTVTVNPRIRGKHFQIYARRDSRRRSTERFVPVEELSRRFRFRLHAAPVTGEAIHFVIPGLVGKNGSICRTNAIILRAVSFLGFASLAKSPCTWQYMHWTPSA